MNVLFALAALAATPADWTVVQPVMADTCYDCHSGKKMKGGVDLERLGKEPQIEAEYELWEKIKEVIAKGEMPPKDETQPTADEKKMMTEWIGKQLNAVAMANAGDPGPVTLRRLTNAEYDYTIRDLTGYDFGLAGEFLPDGGGGEGFSNIGDVLFTNPQQLDKYLNAARKLADHASILPGTGIVFHRQRIGLRSPDQMKDQAEQALYVWYQKMATPHLPKDTDDLREGDYMTACWKWKHREQTGAKSLEQLAKDAGLSLPFLENWWGLLTNPGNASRFLDLTRIAWRNLPGPDAAKPKEVPPPVQAKIAAIQAERRSWNAGKRAGEGVQRRQQDADGLRTYRVNADAHGKDKVHIVLGDIGDGNAGDYVQITGLSYRLKGKTYAYAPAMRQQRDADKRALADIEAGKPAPKGMTAEILKKRIAEADAALAYFGKDPLGKGDVGADVLAAKAPIVITLPLPEGVSEITGSGKLDMRSPEVDQATVQWTATCDAPPDPAQIIPGVLTVWKIRTEAAKRTMGDFSRMKEAFPDMLERRLEVVAENLYRRGPATGVYYLSDEQLTGLLDAREKERWRQMREDWDFLSRSRPGKEQIEACDQSIRRHLNTFASLAWRRPTTQAEEKELAALYADGLARELDRESAAREAIVRVLVSPHFLYKTELSPAPVAAVESGAEDHPVSAWELASRLSYFLWSSKPDAELRKAAADGSLLKREVREAQVKRMLKDPKAQAMAREFMGQWLEFDGFETYSAVDGKKFPEFTPELRNDFYRETLEFFTHLIREDRAVRDIVGSDYTYLNERLAKFYGVPGVSGDAFQKVSVSAQHRGGLLGMGSVLTKTSRSHRTSPVLRGNWLLQAVLGTPVPPPPNNVPELKEHGPKPATVREMLEQHRADRACASCHSRIDPLGFALENFDAIGRFRDKDETGLPLDTSAQVRGGVQFLGAEGLRDYLGSQDAQFTKHFSRKLLGYALGRQVMPSDRPLLKTMAEDMQAADGRISAAVLAIVNSRQFLNRRY